MKSIPVIDFNEFAQFVVQRETIDGTTQVVYDHPDFGRWEQRTFDVGMGRITEQRAELQRPVAVRIKDESLSRHVHHCMSIGGTLGTSFEAGVDAELSPSTYHFLRVKGSNYMLSLGERFHNIHIEISNQYYLDLLSDSEPWSMKLKEQLVGGDFCVAGAYSLTPAMIKNIYEIFNTPMSGLIKRMIIEAKILELIALQWGTSISSPEKSKNCKSTVLFEVKTFLDETFLQEHSLRKICMRFGINEFALKNGFKNQFGTTVFDYLISRRLDHARELLSQPSYSIQQVSALVGYKYANHFATAFKNRFGKTPRSFANRVEA
ncbi:AraC family transcriptional regulator [Chryseolinea sp. T2]|uniref:helix-turn-helix transcriptional regulator n=1 Tax=Chryseolinea sp. T2 TaxID=3129255 RepID=UPI0030780E8B